MKLFTNLSVGAEYPTRSFCGDALEIQVSLMQPSIDSREDGLIKPAISIEGTDRSVGAILSDLEITVESDDLKCQEIISGKPGVDATKNFLFKPDSPGTYKLNFAIKGDLISIKRPPSYVVVSPQWCKNINMYSILNPLNGSIDEWIELFPSIKEMGFNVVHFLPMSMMGSSHSPYSSKDLVTLDPRFGKSQDIEKLINALKDHSLRACVDLVFNHVSIDHPWTTKYPERFYFQSNEKDNIKRSGWYGGDTYHRWMDLALLNYHPPLSRDKKSLYADMVSYGMFWSRVAGETGGMVRLDNMHSSDGGLLREFTDTLHKEYPQVCLSGEMFSSDEEMARSTSKYRIDFLLATPWEKKFVPELVALYQYLHGKKSIRWLIPLCSHDSGFSTQEFSSDMATVPRAASAVLLGTGAFASVQGVESGLKKRPPFIGDEVEEFLANEKSNPQLNAKRFYKDFFKNLLGLKNAHEVLLQSGNLEIKSVCDNAVVLSSRFRARDGKSDQNEKASLVSIINFDINNNRNVNLNDIALMANISVDTLRSGLDDQSITYDSFCPNQDEKDSSLVTNIIFKKILIKDSILTLSPCEVIVIDLNSEK